MTRINVVPVSELCDQHLLAEHRELTRIPNCIATGKLQSNYIDAPTEYVLGTGHVKFFVNKLWWLYERYFELGQECQYRGFSVSHKFPPMVLIKNQNYIPTQAAIELNRKRINERLLSMRLSVRNAARWTNRIPPDWANDGR